MRTLVWSDKFYPYIGGGEIFGDRLLRDLRARGHQIMVVTRRDSDDLPEVSERHGVSVYRFPFSIALQQHDVGRVVAVTRRVARLTREFGPDLVHVHMFGPSTLFFQLTSSASRAPRLVSLLEPTRGRLTAPATAIGSMLRTANWIVACSEAVLREARGQVPEITPRSSVILAALEMPVEVPRPLPFQPPRILCAGRLEPEKGFDLAVKAFGKLARRHPTARMSIAGHGPGRAALERQVAGAGLADRVDFLGWVVPERIPAIINTATLVLTPSRREAFGLVAVQAAQMGRPVVAARVGGLPEVVADGETGLLVEPEYATGLAVAIGELLDQPGRAVAMGAAARQRARDLFDWERCVDAYDGLYHRVGALGQEARSG